MDSGLIGALIGGGGVLAIFVLLGVLRGRRAASGGASAGAAQRAEAAHAQVDEDLAGQTAAIEGEQAADHAAADERWNPGGRP